MAKKLQYYIYKINLSKLSKNDFNINDMTVSEARLCGDLIALGDNQVLHFIRKIRKKDTDLEKLSGLIKDRDIAKNLKQNDRIEKFISEKQRKIDDILFVDDIINVVINGKKFNKKYEKICKQGFFVNNQKYVRFACGAGQARRSTVSFIKEDIFEELNTILMNDSNIQEINLAKFNAYYGLYLSGVEFVREPKAIVIPDCQYEILNKKVDWVVDKKGIDKDTGREYEYRDIEERITNLPINAFDGQGLISPKLCKEWAEDLELDYVPCEFIIRTSFVKGMVVEFDYHKYADENGIKTIKDYWGKEYNVEDVDMILSISQFKMYKFYKSWQDYLTAHKKYNHVWGVARYNKKYDEKMSLLNYQYIQTLDLNKEKIIELAQPTLDWIHKVCSGEELYSMLFLLGVFKETDKFDKIYKNVKNDYAKAILLNKKLLKDSHIKKFIYKSIKTYIEQAKIGKLWVEGNYQFMISDPYGQCQWAFGTQPTGLLQEFEHWAKDKYGIWDACRSPLVDFSEHNLLNYKHNQDTEKWYGHLYSGIIYNIWGTDTIRHSDSDWDGDIVFTTNNKIMVDNVIPDRNVITYDKATAPIQKLTLANLIETDKNSFNCLVGQITNYSTIFITMMGNHKDNEYYRDKLFKRTKLLRRYIGDSIDSAKGIVMKDVPKRWTRKLEIKEDDPEEIVKEKRKRNILVADTKPYFMQYIYPTLKEEYETYVSLNELASKCNFEAKISEVRTKEEKTEEEKAFIKEYYTNMPVLISECPMNELCWYINGVDIKEKFNKESEDCYDLMVDESIEWDEYRFDKILRLYERFIEEEEIKIKLARHEVKDEIIIGNSDLDIYYDQVKREAEMICTDPKELANYAVYISYIMYPNEHKRFVWHIAIEGLLANLELHKNTEVSVPILDENGIEYLGNKYSLKRLEL